jgi:SHS2 domain-containing protein
MDPVHDGKAGSPAPEVVTADGVDSWPAASPPPPSAEDAGHALVPHTADCIIEAWGPDRATCMSEALTALVESFAEAPGSAPRRTLALAPRAGDDPDRLLGLLEEVIYAVDALDAVPVRFHLTETEDGRIGGEMEVVEAGRAHAVGPVPKGISYHGLAFGRADGGWRCHALVDV